jgi:trk system potassium uptake protein TrkA
MRSLRVAIAGAGNVGRSIAGELLSHGHQVLLIDRVALKEGRVPDATFLHADACEIDALERAELGTYDVVVAATGDDKANLVLSLLAKTEYGVPRVVARVNHPKNESLFNESWGVDVSLSTPRMLTALVEEAVSVGDMVRLMRFVQGDASLVEVTLAEDAPVVGQTVGSVTLPEDCALVAILRDGRVVVPSPDAPFEAGDELLAVTTTPAVEIELQRVLAGSGSGSGWGTGSGTGSSSETAPADLAEAAAEADEN